MNSGAREKQIAVRVTDEEKTAFEEKAKQEGKTPSQVLLQFVQSYIGRSSEVDVQAKISQLEAQIHEIQQQLGKQPA